MRRGVGPAVHLAAGEVAHLVAACVLHTSGRSQILPGPPTKWKQRTRPPRQLVLPDLRTPGLEDPASLLDLLRRPSEPRANVGLLEPEADQLEAEDVVFVGPLEGRVPDCRGAWCAGRVRASTGERRGGRVSPGPLRAASADPSSSSSSSSSRPSSCPSSRLCSWNFPRRFITTPVELPRGAPLPVSARGKLLDRPTDTRCD